MTGKRKRKKFATSVLYSCNLLEHICDYQNKNGCCDYWDYHNKLCMCFEARKIALQSELKNVNNLIKSKRKLIEISKKFGGNYSPPENSVIFENYAKTPDGHFFDLIVRQVFFEGTVIENFFEVVHRYSLLTRSDRDYNIMQEAAEKLNHEIDIWINENY